MTETCPACGKTYVAASEGCPHCKNDPAAAKSAKGSPSLSESWEMIDEGWEDVDDLPSPPQPPQTNPQEDADADHDPSQEPAADGGGNHPTDLEAVARDDDSIRGPESESELRQPSVPAPEDAVADAVAEDVAAADAAARDVAATADDGVAAGPKRTRAKGKKKRKAQPPSQKTPKQKPVRPQNEGSAQVSSKPKKPSRPWLLPMIVGLIALVAMGLFLIARKS